MINVPSFWPCLLIPRSVRSWSNTKILLARLGRELVVVNTADTVQDDLMGDFVAIITSFAARLYGRRRAKRKTEQVLAALQQNGSYMSQKPGKADAQEQKRKRKQKTKQTLTHAVTHIRLIEANPGKLQALDQVASVFEALCQQYVTQLCTATPPPDRYADPVFETELSDRWHRVAIQQAAGIAKSWRTNRQAAYDAYLEAASDWKLAQEQNEGIKRKEPEWREWTIPALRIPCIQANVNVVALEKSADSTFDYWLRISTLDKGNTLRIPVNLALYHQKALQGHTLNTSTTLHKRKGVWWLTLSFDEDVPLVTEPSAPKVGADVGITHFITTSTGKQYGSFHGKLARRHKRDREKRRRKAQLRASLKKKGSEKLPSTSSASGQRLGRHVRQEINRAVSLMLDEHPDARILYEDLSVASMRFKARKMNAYLYASNLAHIPEQIAWATAKRGMAAHTVKAAYSSQECHRCHYPDRANRPAQSTFFCIVCHHRDHADHNAALNLASRFGDTELAACKNKGEVKALLLWRHDEWKKHNRLAVVEPAVQLGLWDHPQASTDVAESEKTHQCNT
jgi:transposase